MVDRRQRDVERRWLLSGDATDEAAALAARLRAGELAPGRLSAAAVFGHEASLLIRPRVSLPAARVAELLRTRARSFGGWRRAGCPRSGAGYDPVDVLLWRRLRPWPAATGPLRATVAVLCWVDPVASIRAAWAATELLMPVAAHYGYARLAADVREAVRAWTERPEDPGRADLVDSLVDEIDEQPRGHGGAAAFGLLARAVAEPADPLCPRGVLASCAKSLLDPHRLRRCARSGLEQLVWERMGAGVIPWALGYTPRSVPRPDAERWVVSQDVRGSHGDVYETVTTFTYRLTDARTGRTLLRAEGEDETSPEIRRTGATGISLSADGRFAYVHQAHGTVEPFELPV